ncbi:thiaminase II [Paenibacillus xerothermodurans]|uniref:Aminopyrimidine aminohydrolase n=1 Tax=Paenibacillus xerothermodurans TaxID=1977292 RepID=A0A2W1NR80_PAEXE|nr:thiaminase II [Paenibacillus xerothermodurans]PZE21373.1 thiaminase II [Paenibacillus xerothermodurans]
MKFSEELRQAVDASWNASFEHPFIRGIADGTLPLAKFRHYLLNDSYYLSQFARVQALGAAKATHLFDTNRMVVHAQGTYSAELALHEQFAKQLGITDEERAAFQPAPTAYAYTCHMLSAAYNGHLGDIVAAILPCYWLYFEIGERLQGLTPEEPIYREWINAYGGEWFRELVQEQIDRLDTIAEQVTSSDRERMQRHFVISSHYEHEFWEMADTLESWPTYG